MINRMEGGYESYTSITICEVFCFMNLQATIIKPVNFFYIFLFR